MNSVKKLFLIVALIMLSGLYALSAYSQGMKIVSGYPDFKVKVTRCEVFGNRCIIDMVLENTSAQDVGATISGRAWGSTAYDDEGNVFDVAILSIGNKNEFNGYVGCTLPSQIPLKARLQINGVPEAATMFKKVEIAFECFPWNLRFTDKCIKFFNLPISREGDE